MSQLTSTAFYANAGVAAITNIFIGAATGYFGMPPQDAALITGISKAAADQINLKEPLRSDKSSRAALPVVAAVSGALGNMAAQLLR